MLDVHPAHHAATSWRDFFVHIAQVLLGKALVNRGDDPDLPPTITRTQLNAIRGRSDPLPASLDAAHAITMARLNAAAPHPVIIRSGGEKE